MESGQERIQEREGSFRDAVFYSLFGEDDALSDHALGDREGGGLSEGAEVVDAGSSRTSTNLEGGRKIQSCGRVSFPDCTLKVGMSLLTSHSPELSTATQPIHWPLSCRS